MNTDNHKLITDLSIEYANQMCAGDNERKFCRGSIAAAYVIGAEETLRRVCNVIRESANVGGLSTRQSQTLLRIIDDIEMHPDENTVCTRESIPSA